MCTKSFRIFFSWIIAFHLISPAAHGAEIELEDLALPTETKDLGKTSGAIYYSTTNKNKALMPVHFWGEVGRSGLHYIPVDTKLIKGLSFAGGGTTNADLEEVVVNRVENKKIIRKEFDLSAGGDLAAHDFVLRPGDTVFIEKDFFHENRAYYTGLVGVAISILSSVLIYQRIQQMNND